ncbi:hypothetical protein STAR110904_11255 [Staphylococcus argensis]
MFSSLSLRMSLTIRDSIRRNLDNYPPRLQIQTTYLLRFLILNLKCWIRHCICTGALTELCCLSSFLPTYIILQCNGIVMQTLPHWSRPLFIPFLLLINMVHKVMFVTLLLTKLSLVMIVLTLTCLIQ